MVGLIQRGWLAGVSLGPKSNQKNIKSYGIFHTGGAGGSARFPGKINVFLKKIAKKIRMV